MEIKKMQRNESGFSAVEAVLLLLIVVLIGIVGLKVYQNHNTATKTIMNSTYNKNKTTKPTSTASQSAVVKLPELGVQFTLPDHTLTDFKYVAANVDYNDPGNNSLGTYPTAYLGTKQLDRIGCPATGIVGNAPPLGFLTKTTGRYPVDPTADNTTGTLLKQYPDFYISYRSSGLPCFDDSAKNQIVTTDNQQLQRALKTLDLIK